MGSAESKRRSSLRVQNGPETEAGFKRRSRAAENSPLVFNSALVTVAKSYGKNSWEFRNELCITAKQNVTRNKDHTTMGCKGSGTLGNVHTFNIKSYLPIHLWEEIYNTRSYSTSWKKVFRRINQTYQNKFLLIPKFTPWIFSELCNPSPAACCVSVNQTNKTQSLKSYCYNIFFCKKGAYIVFTWFVSFISSLIRCLSSSSWTWVSEKAASMFTFDCGLAGAARISPITDWDSSSWDSLSNINRWAVEVPLTTGGLLTEGSGRPDGGRQSLVEVSVSSSSSWRSALGSGLDFEEAAVSGVGRGGSVGGGCINAVSVVFLRAGAASSSDWETEILSV